MSLVSDATTKLTYSDHGDQIFLIFVEAGKNGPVSPPAEWPIKMMPTSRRVTDNPRRFGEVLLPPVKALIGPRLHCRRRSCSGRGHHCDR